MMAIVIVRVTIKRRLMATMMSKITPIVLQMFMTMVIITIILVIAIMLLMIITTIII